jgi:hypothetical protein
LALPIFSDRLPEKPARLYLRPGYALLTIAIAAMIVVNLFGSILLLHAPENDYYLERSAWYAGNTRKGDLIICSRDWLWGDYLRRNTQAEVVGVIELLTDKKKNAQQIIDQEIRETLSSGAKVYITSDAVQPEATLQASYGLKRFTVLWVNYQQSWVKYDIAANEAVYILSNEK